MPIDSKEIMAEVRENIRKLDSCVGPHQFARMEQKLFSKYQCSLCQGVISGDNFHWYDKGLLHERTAWAKKLQAGTGEING